MIMPRHRGRPANAETREKSLEVSDSKRQRCGGIPTPGYFAKRGCKLLIIKGGGSKKRAKRLQEIEGSRVRGGGT
jgi:hypothetical protein